MKYTVKRTVVGAVETMLAWMRRIAEKKLKMRRDLLGHALAQFHWAPLFLSPLSYNESVKVSTKWRKAQPSSTFSAKEKSVRNGKETSKILYSLVFTVHPSKL